MRSTKIPNVRFNPDGKKAIIFAVFRYKKSPTDEKAVRLKWSTGETAEPKYWNKKTQRMKNVRGKPEYQDLNDRLNRIASVIRSTYKENNYGEISLEDFKAQIEIRMGLKQEDDRPQDFMSFVSDYNQRRREEPNLKRGTWKNWFSWEKHLSDFFQDTGYSREFYDIDFNFLEAYTSYLFNEKDHSINYVAKQVSTIRQWMHDAWRKDLHNNRRYEAFSVSKTDTNRVALYDDELEILYNTQFEEKHMEETRDLFLMQTATLMRRSDFSRITRDNITEIKTENGPVKLIDVITEKTRERVAIPVFWYLEPLLEKYNYQIPQKLDQVFNRQLKEVCKLAGLDRKILWMTTKGGTAKKEHRPLCGVVASHCARRSGATKLVLDGWPRYAVMKLTGHKTESEFNKYIVTGNRMEAAHMAERYDILTANAKKLRAV